MKDYTPVLDRRRKLREDTSYEIEVLKQQAEDHPELYRYAAALADKKFESIDEAFEIDDTTREQGQSLLVALFFDGYNTRRAVADTAIVMGAKDAVSMATLDELLLDIPDYTRFLKKHTDLRTLIPQLRTLKNSHPELIEYGRESASLYYSPLVEQLGLDPGRPDDKPLLKKLEAPYLATFCAGFLVRQELEKEIKKSGTPPRHKT